MYKFINTKLTLLKVISLIAFTFLLIKSSPVQSYQARCLGVNHATTVSPCDNNIDDHFEEGCAEWIDEMNDHSSYGSTTWDGYVQGVELCDDYFGGGCHDLDANNIDHGDSTLLVTHGTTTWNNHWGAKMSTESANPSGDCLVLTDIWALGNDDAEITSAFACGSANYGKLGKVKNWACKLHQWHGAHGVQCNLYAKQRLDDFADDAFDGSISSAWIYTMLQRDSYCIGSTAWDMCGMSMIFCPDDGSCNIRRINETYNEPDYYDDPPCSGENGINHYICNCCAKYVTCTPSC
jgi:hypothetical protein